MTISNWLAQRGIDTYVFLGTPVAGLRKDEAGDQTLTFLRSADRADVASWLKALGNPPTPENNYGGWGKIGAERLKMLPPVPPRISAEQLMALSDRKDFKMTGITDALPPALLPHDIGRAFKHAYEKFDSNADRRDVGEAVMSYAGVLQPGDRVENLKHDLAGHELQHHVMWGATHAFSDPEKKAWLEGVIASPRPDADDQPTAARPLGGVSRNFTQVRDALSSELETRKDNPPEWAPDLMAVLATAPRGGLPLINWGDEAKTAEAAKRFVQTFQKINPHRSNNLVTDVGHHISQSFPRGGMRGLIDSGVVDSNEQLKALFSYARLLSDGSISDDHTAILSEMEKRLGNSSDMDPTHRREFEDRIMRWSEDPSQLERVARSAKNPLVAANTLASQYTENVGRKAHRDIAIKIAKEYASKKESPSPDDTNLLKNLFERVSYGSPRVLRDIFDNTSVSRGTTVARAMAVAATRISTPTEGDKQFANEVWKKAFSNIGDGRLHTLPNPEMVIHRVGRGVNMLEPSLLAQAAFNLGTDSADYSGWSDDHIDAVFNHRGFQERFPHHHSELSEERETRKPAEPIKFAQGSNRLRQLREHLFNQPDQRAHKKQLEQNGFNVQNLGLNPLLDAKGNLTHERVDQHINSLPQRELEFKTKTWSGMQRHSEATQKVFAVGLPKALAHELHTNDHDAYRHLQNNANRSSEGGHPTLPERGIGWVRYTEGPDGVHIDEIQSDFGSNFRARVQENYGEDKLAEFERIYHQVWQGKRPNEVLHDAFLEHMRQQGNVGKPIHVWDLAPKMDLAGQNAGKKAPAHMQETYKVMPAKAGYVPSTYGKIQTQDNPDLSGQPTWEQKLTKFETQLDGWFADRLSKGWRSSLLGAVAAGSMALGAGAPKHEQRTPPAPAESQGELTASNKVAGATGTNGQTMAVKLPPPKWTPEGLPEEMHPIAHLESSFGRNLNHAAHPQGDFQTAFGAVGLKPQTAHFEYMKRPSLRAMHPGLENHDAFTDELKTNPRFYNQVAGAHFAWLKQALGGDPGKAAYGWRWGVGAAQQASPEQIEADPYVQKYRTIRAQAQQTAMNDIMDSLLKKHVIPTVAVRIEDAKLQMLSGDNWETVAEKAPEGGWNLLGNPARSAKLLARCLIEGQELDA